MDEGKRIKIDREIAQIAGFVNAYGIGVDMGEPAPMHYTPGVGIAPLCGASEHMVIGTDAAASVTCPACLGILRAYGREPVPRVNTGRISPEGGQQFARDVGMKRVFEACYGTDPLRAFVAADPLNTENGCVLRDCDDAPSANGIHARILADLAGHVRYTHLDGGPGNPRPIAAIIEERDEARREAEFAEAEAAEWRDAFVRAGVMEYPQGVQHVRLSGRRGFFDVQTPAGGVTCAYDGGPKSEAGNTALDRCYMFAFAFRSPLDRPSLRGLQRANDRLYNPAASFQGTVDTSGVFGVRDVLTALAATVRHNKGSFPARDRLPKWWAKANDAVFAELARAAKCEAAKEEYNAVCATVEAAGWQKNGNGWIRDADALIAVEIRAGDAMDPSVDAQLHLQWPDGMTVHLADVPSFEDWLRSSRVPAVGESRSLEKLAPVTYFKPGKPRAAEDVAPLFEAPAAEEKADEFPGWKPAGGDGWTRTADGLTVHTLATGNSRQIHLEWPDKTAVKDNIPAEWSFADWLKSDTVPPVSAVHSVSL